eukprot:jgi/Astpho2/1041/Aster-00860
MSIITVQLGQCGNQVRELMMHKLSINCCAQHNGCTLQIGLSMFDRLAAEGGTTGAAAQQFFRQQDPEDGKAKPAARAVLLDMEPKVVQAAMQAARRSSSQWQYATNSGFTQQSGSGNNWARGYMGYGQCFSDAACELVRREVEETDHFGGFLMLQSMAGGTGAGFGARVAEALRDEFPCAFLMNHCIWPYESGEVVVQSYNTMLTLSHLSSVSDGIVLVENSTLNSTCQKVLKIARPSIHDINRVAAQSLAATLLPSRLRPAAGCSGLQGKSLTLFGDHVEHLCCHPGYRMLTLRNVPQMPAASVGFTTFTWEGTLKRLRQMQVTGSTVEHNLDWNLRLNRSGDLKSRPVNKSLAALLTLRGQGAMDADATSFADPGLYPPWALQALAVAASPQRFADCDMSASLVANDQSCIGPISTMLGKAYNMYSVRAYLHQYQRCGLEEQDLELAFARAEELLGRYRAM